MTTPRDRAAARDELIAAALSPPEKFARHFIERFRAEIPAYRTVDPADVADSVLRAFQQVIHGARDGHPLGAPELAEFREYGAQRARQGIPLEAVLRAWQIAVREAIDLAVAGGRARGIDDALLMDFTTDVLTVTDDASLAFSAGHRDAAAAMDRQDDLRRAELVRRLLFSDAPRDEIRTAAAQYGLDADRRYLTLRAKPFGNTPVFEISEELLRQPACRPPAGLISILDDDVIGICVTPPAIGDHIVAGIGPAADLGDHTRSVRLATRALTTARACRMPGAHHFPDLGLLPAILADTDVGDTVSDLYIAPVGEGEAATAILDTIADYLGSGMHIGATAKRMSVHQNTVRYRIARFEELTGTSLRDPDVALQAWWALRRRAIGR